MSIMSAIYTTLSTTSAITNLVGARIYPNTLPQDVRETNKYPAIMFETVTNPQDHNMSTDDTPEHPTIAMHSYGQTYQIADDIRTQVITLFKDFSGEVTGSGITFQRIFLNDIFDQYISETETHDLIVNTIAWGNRIII